MAEPAENFVSYATFCKWWQLRGFILPNLKTQSTCVNSNYTIGRFGIVVALFIA